MAATPPLWSFAIRHEQDVVTARQRAAQIAGLVGFDSSEQTRIATAVSEIVRNAFRYAGGGVVEISIEGQTIPQLLIVKVGDRGRGIANLDDVMAGRYKSTTGMGIGLMGTRRLMDQFDIASSPAGTIVTLKKLLPRRAPFIGPARVKELVEKIHAHRPGGLVDEIQRQNQELLRTLDELQRRQEELVRLNRELEDTNRGVVALYAELDEKADHLRRADELKSRFLSNMTHEFRTPVNSILALTDLLGEQLQSGRDTLPELAYIRKSAEQLSELVNDMLDLAKVEAGKTTVRRAPFEVGNLFGALRGMLRPLLVNRSVSLLFDEPVDLPTLHTDEGKVSQVLRNFISNALKYTEKGEVRVSASLDAGQREIIFTVADTGIGVARDDLARIFEEFVQIDHPLQRGVKGTGLGLPLSKRLAELLGGRVWVHSELGVGSTFSVAIPIVFEPRHPAEELPLSLEADGRHPILVLEDEYSDQLFYEKILKDSRYHIYPARTVAGARDILRRARPAAIVLDVLLDGEDTWQFLSEIKSDPETRAIPVVVVTTLDDARKGLALGADVYATKPVNRQWLLTTLDTLLGKSHRQTKVLVVDDQEAARYIVRQFLRDPEYAIIEAGSGAEGIDRARETHPDVILLDLGLGDMNGREVLHRLKSDPATSRPPVIIVTSSRLPQSERDELALSVAAIVSKDSLSSEVIRESIRHARNAAGSSRG
jgi:signal transduction histidine kinase/CheY-like chemotaxis protein